MVPFDLVGNYDCRLDEKGRLKLPSELLAQLGPDHADTFVLNRGFEKCLVLYPKVVWERFTEQVRMIPDFSGTARQFRREFYRDSYRLVKDGAGRLLFSRGLLDYAGIDRDVTLECQGDKIEIWKTDAFEGTRMNPEDFAELAEKYFSGLYKGNNP
ncbi:MAG: division/cell wall cluster transcriptional repressor MraZ [Saprospiraceae bacterium]|nr:division/cell wall cluster transcriptional repressor MraZ [Saprospiraceae bacterium]